MSQGSCKVLQGEDEGKQKDVESGLFVPQMLK